MAASGLYRCLLVAHLISASRGGRARQARGNEASPRGSLGTEGGEGEKAAHAHAHTRTWHTYTYTVHVHAAAGAFARLRCAGQGDEGGGRGSWQAGGQAGGQGGRAMRAGNAQAASKVATS